MSATHPAALPTKAASAPPYTLREERTGTRLRIGDWEIASCKRPILNGREIEAAETTLAGLPLPEMTFGNNTLTLAHGSGTTLHFDALESLKAVAVGEGWEERVGGAVLVSMADKWSGHREAATALTDVPLSSKPVRPHDWTFSTCYPGHTSGGGFTHSDTHDIPMRLLARQDPVLDRILFYDDVVLFEDELHDNGESTSHVRIRVMPHSFFILARVFVRVDHVLFRVFDVRVYHAFGSREVIRQTSGLEADYDDVKRYLEKPDDLSPLTDANFVYQALGKLAARNGGPTSAKKITGKPWPGLGGKVEVLLLPEGKEESEAARAELEKLNLGWK
ncbi:hypothetical protein VHUM_03974 [Vanrija humicola]|uniref:TIP41-like protein n=1 Tax=Vanrija humicola TaxID=5417 RepID=A0A7D8V2M2_VANHU|nr:hypothetical protein VHUM_03974 [Vanrija humicola]